MKNVPFQHGDRDGLSEEEGKTPYNPDFKSTQQDKYIIENESKEQKPQVKFISDPSKRLYYYAYQRK